MPRGRPRQQQRKPNHLRMPRQKEGYHARANRPGEPIRNVAQAEAERQELFLRLQGIERDLIDPYWKRRKGRQYGDWRIQVLRARKHVKERFAVVDRYIAEHAHR